MKNGLSTGRILQRALEHIQGGGSPRLRMWAKSLVVALLLFPLQESQARIPEPGNIVYGLAGIDDRRIVASDTGVEIIARNAGNEVVATYRMGENAQAGDFFVLRIPIHALGEIPSNSTQSGDQVSIVLLENGLETPLGEYQVGGRGLVMRVNYGVAPDSDNDGVDDGLDTDDDNDGMPDTFEEQYGFDPLNPSDGRLDADGDGVSNVDEYRAGTNPRDPTSVLRGDSSSWLQLLLTDEN